LIVSGGLSEYACDFYKQIAEMAKTSNSKLIIDTSGEPLRKALSWGLYD
jgi:6-phosphofructokinase 2